MRRYFLYTGLLVLLLNCIGCGTSPVTSDMLTMSGLTEFSAVASVNKSTATGGGGWQTDKSSSGAWLRIDVGSNNAEAYSEARIYASTPGYAGNYSIQYSDDDINYKNTSIGFIPSKVGWNEAKWEKVGKHRYWRFLLTNTPGPGSWLTELEMK